ncbi:hypothetical protein Tco_0056074, partial [Tanacetum coccineum]
SNSTINFLTNLINSNAIVLSSSDSTTKPGVDSLSFEDLYNNLRVFEPDVKGSTASSSSTSSGYNPQMEGPSLYTDELMYSLFANQSSGPQLDHEDLE